MVELITTIQTPILKNRVEFREQNDCTVLAVAIAMNLDYKWVHDELSRNGRQDGCGLRVDWLSQWLLKHNFQCRTDLVNVSLRSIAPILMKGRYVLRNQSHCFAAVDGKVFQCGWPIRGKVKRVYVYMGPVP
jgi:hypothetical protein